MNLVSESEFRALFESAGLDIGQSYEKFALYADMLAEKNAVMNLTAIREPAEVAEKHFLDSCLPLKMFELPFGAEFCDVGTGAGFPGVPIAVMRPDIKLTLIDSLNKRVIFLKELCAALGISAECVHIRAEDAGRGNFAEKFDVVSARAVSRLSKLCGYCLPLLKVGGAFLALKGSDCGEEISEAESEISKFGGTLEKTVSYALPSGDRRTLVIIRKTERRTGKPAKK